MDITTVDGKKTHLEPTMSDQHRKEAAATKKRAEAHAAKLEAQAAKRNRPKATVSDIEYRKIMLKGLKRLAKKSQRAGEENKGEELGKLATEAEAALKRYEDLSKQVSGKKPAPLHDAATKAAGALVKNLPGCFDSKAEAATWALSNLPLTAAKQAQSTEDNKIRRLSRKRHEAGHTFWEKIEVAGIKSKLGPNALKEIRLLGEL